MHTFAIRRLPLVTAAMVSTLAVSACGGAADLAEAEAKSNLVIGIPVTQEQQSNKELVSTNLELRVFIRRADGQLLLDAATSTAHDTTLDEDEAFGELLVGRPASAF